MQERSAPIEATPESMQLIYHVRMTLFYIFERDSEQAFFLMKLAKLYRKQKSDALLVSNFFSDCRKLEHKIIDFEYEYAKYIDQVKNAHEAY
jgi:hypothetical protein